MKREYMIEALVVDSVVRILDRHCAIWLNDILERGFRGFANMNDHELRGEMISRGLIPGNSDVSGEEDPYCACDDLDDDPNLLQAQMEHNRRDARVFEAG